MNLSIKSDQEIFANATPIMDNLMKGSTEIDHNKHTRDFTERLKRIVTKEHLEQICSRYQAEWGYFSRRECIAVFRRPSSVAIVWRQWCTKQECEFVAEMVLIKHDSKYLVDNAMVF